ncbi:MAG TPA: helix-turn-helix domain-containing protein [Mizugakiibacter sp.]
MKAANPAGRLPPDPNPIADDGDEVRFCTTCAFSASCMANGYGKPELRELHCLVEHVGPYRAGEHVFRTLDPFKAVFAVRAGTVKTAVVDENGREQVLGFYLPGELVGLNAIYPEHYPCDAVALDTAYFCRFSFPAMSQLAQRMPAVQSHLFRLLSKEVGAASVLAGDYSADERMAAFLVDLADRYAARGFSAHKFRLSMSRGDIANYLRLAAETVSRVLGRFREQELIHVDGRDVEILDDGRLREQARCILRR